MNRNLLAAFFLLFSVPNMAATPDFSTMEDLGGAMIGGVDSKFGYFVYQGNGKQYLVLKKLTGHKNTKALWSQLDYIRLPDIPKDSRFVYVLCNFNGKFDPGLAAVATITETEMLGTVTYAWRANLEKGKIISVPTDGIECMNEAFGL